jgi:hypothetical protein
MKPVRNDEDRTIISARLIKVGLDAVDKVADELKVDFSGLDLEAKRSFLEHHGKAVVMAAAEHPQYGRFFVDRVVLWIEAEGNAGLIFTKKRKN